MDVVLIVLEIISNQELVTRLGQVDLWYIEEEKKTIIYMYILMHSMSVGVHSVMVINVGNELCYSS